jgi:hypothetical protein
MLTNSLRRATSTRKRYSKRLLTSLRHDEVVRPSKQRMKSTRR